MTWNDRLIRDNELVSDVTGGSMDLRTHVRALLEQQAATWPMFREAMAAMADVQSKKIIVKNSEVIVQFNPQRIVSAVAKVDAATIRGRPCFLCVENLPLEEKGIAFQDDYVILCNPFPVLADHLVISARRHTPQEIAGNFGALLDVTRELGKGWFTLYNGPRCGASAPDHLHFQACHAALIPIFRELGRFERRTVKADRSTDRLLDVFTLVDYRIEVLIAQGNNHQDLQYWFDSALSRLAKITGDADEPMINLVANYLDDRWTVIVFPRQRHRPSCYYAEGDDQLIVSPAAIDLAGILIAPRQQDFTRINAKDIEQINNEVMLERRKFSEWVSDSGSQLKVQ